MNSLLAHLETVLDPATFEKVMKSIEEQDPSGIGNRSTTKDPSTAVEARQKLLERFSASAKGKEHGDSGGGAK